MFDIVEESIYPGGGKVVFLADSRQTLMVSSNEDGRSLNPCPPYRQSKNDSEKFLVLCRIATLGVGEFVAFICHQMQFGLSGLRVYPRLLKDRADAHIRGVGVNDGWVSELDWSQNGRGRQGFFDAVEGVPVGVSEVNRGGRLR